jgi:hypothetical protein
MTWITFDEIVKHKEISQAEQHEDLQKLKKFSATENKRCFAGNPFLYHHQMANLCKVKVNNKPSLFDIVKDKESYTKLYNNTMKLKRTGTLANRLFEANRFNNAVVFFKPTTAKWLYKKMGATAILDPTAGWGGRMLGAWALDIPYTGIDTNTNMIPAYEEMMMELATINKYESLICADEYTETTNYKMIWQNCLTVDFSTINYDFVLTSPPYINLEVYENMTPYKSNEYFYKKFLIPLLDKCLANIKNDGWVCFNISSNMYADLMKFGYRQCDAEEDLLQQKRLGKDKQDKIYCWKKA